jgi:hypothetical protein
LVAGREDLVVEVAAPAAVARAGVEVRIPAEVFGMRVEPLEAVAAEPVAPAVAEVEVLVLAVEAVGGQVVEVRVEVAVLAGEAEPAAGDLDLAVAVVDLELVVGLAAAALEAVVPAGARVPGDLVEMEQAPDLAAREVVAAEALVLVAAEPVAQVVEEDSAAEGEPAADRVAEVQAGVVAEALEVEEEQVALEVVAPVEVEDLEAVAEPA